MPGKIVSLVNFKGGVGKTTLTVNLAACLAKEHDKKVLIVDLDPQSNSSIWLLGPALWSTMNKEGNFHQTSEAMFVGRITEDMFRTPFREPTGNFLPEFYLCPSTLNMLDLEEKILLFRSKRLLEQKYQRGDEYVLLGKAAQLLREKFDFVLIDCPPNLYLATCNAFCQSDYILIPCIPDELSTSGLKQMIERMEKTIHPLLGRLKQVPRIMGVAITKLKGVNEHQLGLSIIESVLADFRNADYHLVDESSVVFSEQPIREYIVFAEAVSGGLPLCLYAPRTQAYNDVKAFTQAFLAAIERRQ